MSQFSEQQLKEMADRTANRKQDKENEIIDLSSNISTIQSIGLSVAVIGGIGGAFYAYKKGKGFWGKFGFFCLGSFLIGVPYTLVTRPIQIKKLAEITKLQNELGQSNKAVEVMDMMSQKPIGT